MSKDRGYQWAELGARIREARVGTGLTQKQLSQLVGVSPHAVWSWESGKMRPTPERLVDLAHFCQTTTDRLLGRKALEAEILNQMDSCYRRAIEGLPVEDLESIQNFIQFVSSERQRKNRAGL